MGVEGSRNSIGMKVESAVEWEWNGSRISIGMRSLFVEDTLQNALKTQPSLLPR